MLTRTMQEGQTRAQNFQAKVAPCFAKLSQCLKAWIDDFTLYTRTEQELLSALGRIFEICHDRNLNIFDRKTELFTTELKWCGRIILQDGVRYDPHNASGLTSCALPISAGGLCEYVHCIGWMRNKILDQAPQVAPLVELLEVAFKTTGKRTKCSIKSIPLSKIGWNTVHETCFRDLQSTLSAQRNLPHRNESLQLCIFYRCEQQVLGERCDAM